MNMQKNETLLTLNDQQEQINQLSQEISSGVKLASPSDDPSAWAQVMNIQQSQREYKSFLNGISFATGWGQATESALSQLSDLVSQAKQIAITGSSANSTSENASLASEVNGILQQVVTLANSQYGDQYIFAGTSTTTAPFSIDGSTGKVNYSGDSNSITVKTGSGNASNGGSTVVNLTGDQVFNYSSGGSTLNVLHEIWGLKQAIQTGDSATISSKLTTLDDAFNHINNEATTVGSMLSGLTTRQSAISAFQTNEQSTLSNLQDADMASAAIKLQQVQTAFQSALHVTSMLGNLNLASYLSGSSTA
ncbi:MAG: flagellar hook-associated protein FlgL [Syntrophobacteraceae bacterium]|jgi:flagellar hook-associated protein 3 FlgL